MPARMRRGGSLGRQSEDRPQDLVRHFHEAFGLGAPEHISVADFPGELRVRLIAEELDEFADAVRRQDPVAMIDALCDLLYVVYGAGVALGVDLEPFFREVHRSNMAKAGGDTREDGKQLKPEGWEPPQIAAILEQQKS